MYTFGKCSTCNSVQLHEKADHLGNHYFIQELRHTTWSSRSPLVLKDIRVAICTVCNSANEFGRSRSTEEIVSYGIIYKDHIRDARHDSQSSQVTTHQQWQTDIASTTTTPIPQQLHVYWSGPAFPTSHLEAFLKWRAVNKHLALQLNLWTEDKDYEELSFTLSGSPISVLTVSSLEGSDAILEAIRFEEHPIARSDIFRQLILRNHGGIYMDCGTLPSGKLPNNMAFLFHPKVKILAGKTMYIENRVIVMDPLCEVAQRVTAKYIKNAINYYKRGGNPVSLLCAETAHTKKTQLIPFSRISSIKNKKLSEIFQLASYFFDADLSGDNPGHETREALATDKKLSNAFNSIGYLDWYQEIGDLIGRTSSSMRGYLLNFVAHDTFISQLNSWRYPQMNKLIGLGRDIITYNVKQREDRYRSQALTLIPSSSQLSISQQTNPLLAIQHELEFIVGSPVTDMPRLRYSVRQFILSHSPKNTLDKAKNEKFEYAQKLLLLYYQIYQSGNTSSLKIIKEF
jgi:hypothetical protein